MSNDPSNFFMIDGPLLPMSEWERHRETQEQARRDVEKITGYPLHRRPESVTVQEVIDHLQAKADYGRAEGVRGGLEAWEAVGVVLMALSEISQTTIEEIRRRFNAG